MEVNGQNFDSYICSSISLRFSRRWLWRMPSSGMLRRVALVRTDISEGRSSSQRGLLVTANVVHRLLSPWWWRRYIPTKRRFLQEPHGVTSQRTAFFFASVLTTPSRGWSKGTGGLQAEPDGLCPGERCETASRWLRRAEYFLFFCAKLAALVLPTLQLRHFGHVLGRTTFTLLEQEKYSWSCIRQKLLRDHFGNSTLLPVRICSLRTDDRLIISWNWFGMSDERSSFLFSNRKLQLVDILSPEADFQSKQAYFQYSSCYGEL
jgi:hypothetical protein